MDSKSVFLSKLKFSQRALIPRDLLVGAQDPELEIRDVFSGMVAELNLYIMTEKLGEHVVQDNKDITFQVPRTWVDHFKLAYRNKWWMKLIPRHKNINIRILKRRVNMRIIIDPRLLFPETTRKFPQELGKPVKYYRYDYDMIIWNNDEV